MLNNNRRGKDLCGKEEFRPSQVNEVDENQNLHYCGECKEAFYDILG
jgi:hypothetical protein